ncbi:MAG TPA: STAS domain-containing protein [Candidatus Acidoferrum sp.]|nr:STAS domain-containing protein [Candidatus Acidoferrum sp.]
MEIVTQQLADALEVKVKGRLDNYWGEHLQRNLEELIRGGAHHLRLNFSEVAYLSSAGVGLLIRFYRQLKAIGGSFVIVAPSDHVKLVIELCHLSPLLFSQQAAAAPPIPQAEPLRFTTATASFELIERSPARALTWEPIGAPALLRGGGFGPQDCRTIRFPASTFGIGLGAFGHGFEDARTRFGEFLAVVGSAAYLPTDGTNVPDFMVSSGDLVPELNTLYGLRCEGDFSHLLRFEATAPSSAVSLTDILSTGLEVTGSSIIGLVMIAESAGLVGAALRRPPATESVSFQYPDIRIWLSFSTERLYSRSLALVAGVASTASPGPVAPHLRPLGTDILGHFHGAAFSHRPLPKGEIDLKSTVTALFESENLQAVLHLLTDDRQAAGPQQSEFVRGACWISALSGVQ